MNIHKYLIPASIAATVHVALFTLTPEAEPIIIEVPLVAKPPPAVNDRPIEQPEDVIKPEEFEKEVRPLAGGPTLPGSEEPPPGLTKAEFTIPQDERPRSPVTELNKIPGIGNVGGFEPGGLGGENPSFFAPNMLDRTPRTKVQMPPDYPYAMKQAGLSGSVMVEFDVDTAGRVIRAEAIRYTHQEFVEPAVRAVRKWRFEPGRRDGRAVPFRMAVPIEFGIDDRD